MKTFLILLLAVSAFAQDTGIPPPPSGPGETAPPGELPPPPPDNNELPPGGEVPPPGGEGAPGGELPPPGGEGAPGGELPPPGGEGAPGSEVEPREEVPPGGEGSPGEVPPPDPPIDGGDTDGDLLPPTQAPVCSVAADVHFILDSSSSVFAENFELMKIFTEEIISSLDISHDKTRISLNRYTDWVDSRFYFNTFSNKEEVLQAVTDVPYYGRGTQIGKALGVTADHHLQKYSGWRNNEIPTVVIIISNGINYDPEAVAANSLKLHAKSTLVIAIGAGEDVNFAELQTMATAPEDENAIMLDSFAGLLDNQVLNIVQKICDAEGDPNECLVSNGNCSDVCVNTAQGYYCECERGYELAGDLVCIDTNECDDGNNGGCGDACINTPGSFECACNSEGTSLAHDKVTCVIDSCYPSNDCSQNCNNVVNGDYVCSCNPGYRLEEDGTTCTDVDECLTNNGGCEHMCENTDGSFVCSCYDGLGLRADGFSCGTMCYVCENAESNDQCQSPVVCGTNERSCQTETRTIGDVTYITKRCKQTEACFNNHIQNPRDAWLPSQCNDVTGMSVCRCCCHENLCNSNDTCNLDGPDPGIQCPAEDTIEIPDGVTLTCSGNKVGDYCDVICPEGYGPDNGMRTINCAIVARTLDADWSGKVGSCVDINECANNNGGCSHTCTNNNGSYVCSCPTDFNSCADQQFDLFFIVDSSEGVGVENFDKVLNFVNSVTAQYTIGSNAVQVGLMTYTGEPRNRFDFNEIDSADALVDAMSVIEYEGNGTRTAKAVNFAVDTRFGGYQGRRGGVPLVVYIITNGRTHDHADLAAASNRLAHVASKVLAIGVDNARVSECELRELVNGNGNNYRVASSFDDLANYVDILQPCAELEGVYFLTNDNHTCDMDECAVANGGCSDTCTNTIGSFTCTCNDPTETLLEDGKTCGVDPCPSGCNHPATCISGLTGARCCCGNGLKLAPDGISCEDLNECEFANGGCSHECENLNPGYQCLCPEGLTLDTDLLTCVIDSCIEAWMDCAHTCINIPDGEYVCLCDDGYYLEIDGHNCTEINECDYNNGGCQHICVNTDGGYECECTDNMVLREDGKSCAMVCHVCINAESLDDCNGTITCPYGADACFTTMRTRDNVTTYTKGCQQELACINNLIQNPRDSGEGPSQCNEGLIHSKCECCCFDSSCNKGACPHANDLPGCPAFEKENVLLYGYQSANSQVMAGGIAKLVCPSGFAPSQGSEGRLSLNCVYSYENKTAEWDGTPEDLDICVDINECEWNNGTGTCQAPATCVNSEGSHECVCPDDKDDYELIGGTICERDECADLDAGGCSHNCTNTVGSYHCFCTGDMTLLEDGLTCNYDECRENNGGCQEICINTLIGNTCACSEGYEIADDLVSCDDINECLVNNGGCETTCDNIDGSFTCSCADGFYLRDDGFSCKADPCWIDNGGCQQECLDIDDVAVCDCFHGYQLLEDGACVDINECEHENGKCSHNCTNTEGSYVCECPLGTALHSDTLTCGRACYVCNGAATNEECNAQGIEVCPPDTEACENEVRVHGGRKQIFKRCKQRLSCERNYIQNPRQAFLLSQCNGGTENDVCRCCCDTHLCNIAERPCASLPRCYFETADVLVMLDSSSSIKYNNFQQMKAFASSILQTFTIGEDAVHASLMTFNDAPNTVFDFWNGYNLDEVLDAVDNTPYAGSGTQTGAALQYAVDNLLTEDAGKRDVPTIVVLVTDGKSEDDVTGPAAALSGTGANVVVIGVGNADPAELSQIGTSVLADSFDALHGIVFDQVGQEVCPDTNECNDTNNVNGGCDDKCVNTPGSYYCQCTKPGEYLDADLSSCVTDGPVPINECNILNGGCSDGCEDTLEGYNCTCPAGFELSPADQKTCVDTNECSADACSHLCVNTIGSYYCECPSTHEMSPGGCVARVADADCAALYSPVGHSCMRFFDEPATYDDAKRSCWGQGGRLVKVADRGVLAAVSKANSKHRAFWIGLEQNVGGDWENTDGTPVLYKAYESDPPAGHCGSLKDGNFGSAECDSAMPYACEITRSTAFVTFINTWDHGAQAKLYMATDQNTATVNFPVMVDRVNAWFCSVVASSGSSWLFEQTDIQRQSGGQCEFVVDMKTSTRFPDYEITVT